MNLIFKTVRSACAMVFAAMLCACGVSVEQPPGNKVHAAAALSGNWNTSIDANGARRGVLSIQPDGDELSLQWRGDENEGASGHAAVFEYHGRQYVALSNSPETGGYVLLRLEDCGNEHIHARALDGGRAAQLLKQTKRPVVYRELWLRKELFLDKAAFVALMEGHADALFDHGVAVTLDKVR